MPAATRSSGPAMPANLAAASRQRASAWRRMSARSFSACCTRNTSDMPQVKPKRWRKAVKRRESAAVRVEVRSAPYSSCGTGGGGGLWAEGGGRRRGLRRWVHTLTSGAADSAGVHSLDGAARRSLVLPQPRHPGTHVEDMEQAVLAKRRLVHAAGDEPVAPDVHVPLAVVFAPDVVGHLGVGKHGEGQLVAGVVHEDGGEHL